MTESQVVLRMVSISYRTANTAMILRVSGLTQDSDYIEGSARAKVRGRYL